MIQDKSENGARKLYNIGLDVGTAFIVSAVNVPDESKKVALREIRNVFLSIDKGMKFHTKAKIVELDGKKYVLGSQAVQLAALINKSTRRPLRSGVLSATEKDAAEVLGVMLNTVLPRNPLPGSTVCFSIPADIPEDPEFSTDFHADVISKVLEGMGYKASYMTEGLAAAYGIDSEDPHLVTVSMGAGMCNVACTYELFPFNEFAIPKGGDWIDEHVARWIGKPVERCVLKKESEGFDLYDDNKYSEAYLSAYKSLLKELYTKIYSVLEDSAVVESGAQPVLQFSGGTSLVGGFLKMAENVLEEHDLKEFISEIRVAPKTSYVVAYGLLYAIRDF